MPRTLLHYAVSLVGLVPLAMHAATPPDAGEILNEQQRANPPAPRRADPPVIRTEPVPVAPTADGLRVQLRSVRFSGATGLASDHELQDRVQGSLGKTLGHADLQQLADDLTAWLRGRGFVLARAYLPRQDLTAGDLEIALIDGRLQSGPGRVVIRSDARIPAERLAAIANAALPDAALYRDDLERGVLLINDLPGVTARAALEPGDTSGTSRIVIDAHEAAPYTGGVTLDNFSSRSVGSARLGGHVEWNDPMRIGDALGLLAYVTSGTDTLGAFYSAPLTPGGLRLTAAASTLRYRVGGDLKALDLKGSADAASLVADYPLLRTRDRNVNLQFGYGHKTLIDDGNGANLRHRWLNEATAALSGNLFDGLGGGGMTEGGAALTAGNVDLSGNEVDRRLDAASARTDGAFHKAAFHVSRVQSLGDSAPEWTLFASLSSQVAGGNLDSSEKFILGGPSGVRAYGIGEATADDGVLATFEVRRNIDLGNTAKAVGIAFIDSGRVRLHHTPWPGSIVDIGNANAYGLTGVGLGVNVAAGAWSLRSTAARGIGGNAGRAPNGTDVDGRTGRNRIWVQATLPL